MVSYYTGGLAVAEEDDAFFGEEGVNENDDGVGIRAVCCEVRVEGKRLRVLSVRSVEGCY